ncbi:MAG: glycosyl hydrolase-related protein [Opitutales bacterium]|nr:glycosyl hydrolase-related protein [Opitutales bacterium]
MMKTDTPENRIQYIKVVSNTHWDREFRKSFERTRHGLLRMMDTTLEILENDPEFHSFTLDGHSILIDDYLELRPEKKALVQDLLAQGRLVAGPYYTLAEEFSIGQEALVRNLIWGRKTVEKHKGKVGTVAYTPSSWGQTGQLPQILLDFGIDKMMFYRGISHHESKAEYLWQAPDGSRVYASRFAIYARYNWYYLVHRMVSRGTQFDKTYHWGAHHECPVRLADGESEADPSFDLQKPALSYDAQQLKPAIESMIEAEGAHFTTPVFLAMNGHDISAPHPLESQVISDAKKQFEGRYDIEHCDLERFWESMLPHFDAESATVLTGERRAYLKEGMWTFLFPGTISARTYLKQQDAKASNRLVYLAEPLACLSHQSGMSSQKSNLDRAWTYLMSNHTHDANGGCAPDAVCKDMEYRYRKTTDLANITIESSLSYVATNLSSDGQSSEVQQLLVYNPLPHPHSIVTTVDLEVAHASDAQSVELISEQGDVVNFQPISCQPSSVFVDSIWEVPTILASKRMRFYAEFKNLPAMGYRTYEIRPRDVERRMTTSLITGPNTMENEFLKLKLNSDGTIDLENKATGKCYERINYLLDDGETGNAWQHESPAKDQIFNSLGCQAKLSITLDGPLVSTLTACYDFELPADYADGSQRSSSLISNPVQINYTLEKGSPLVKVEVELDNRAKDHRLRAAFPTLLKSDYSVADSHFDVVKRSIELPDSNGWVEEVQGTQPLQTFVDLHDDQQGLAIFSKGLFEYEILHHRSSNTIALTLLRACRIKLKVSEEKISELPDEGIQCPGKQRFEYAIFPHEGDYLKGQVPQQAKQYLNDLKLMQCGKGSGILPHQQSLLHIENPDIQLSAFKPSEDGDGYILRVFNTSESDSSTVVRLGYPLKKVSNCGMAEDADHAFEHEANHFQIKLGAKKILSLRIQLQATS